MIDRAKKEYVKKTAPPAADGGMYCAFLLVGCFTSGCLEALLGIGAAPARICDDGIETIADISGYSYP